MKKTESSSRFGRLKAFIVSPKFFYAVIIFFTLSSVWVAVSSLYPMAFDEDFHYGLIKLYAEHWGPFSLVQAESADKYGSIVTDPSYLYHYLMSFPYRLLHALTNSEMAIVIVLRLLNVAMMVAAIWLYRKLLLTIGVSRAVTHVVLAVFVLIPVLPLLAGQINYDNLIMVIIAGALLLAIQIRDNFRIHKTLPLQSLFYLVLLLLLGSIVKYAFLPIAMGVGGYVLYEIVRVGRSDSKVLPRLWQDMRSLRAATKWMFVGFFFVTILLFSQRYVLNVATYHDPVPDCGRVVGEARCLAYGPWGRDYLFAQDKAGFTVRGPISYTIHDFSWGMWNRLFFALAGPTNEYQTRKPLPVPAITAIVLVVASFLLVVWFGRSLLRQYPVFVLFIIISTVYIAALWLQVYQAHVYTARPVAINGRYLLPLLPLLGAIAAVAWSKFFSRIGRPAYKSIFASVVILVFLLQGGGITTYIVRSESTWFWPGSWMQDANNGLRSGLKPLVYHGIDYFEYW